MKQFFWARFSGKLSFLEWLLLPLALLLIYHGYHENDHKPHHVRVTLGRIVLSDYWSTNSARVSYFGTNVLTMGGYSNRVILVTNYLW